MPSSSVRGCILAILAVMIWSGNFIIARWLHVEVPPVGLAFWRWTVATLALLPFVCTCLKNQTGVIKDNIFLLSVTAFLGVTVFNTLIYIAAHSTETVNLSLIAICAPIFIIIFDCIFYRTSFAYSKLIGIILGVAGVLLVISRGSLSRLTDLSFAPGDLIMLLGAMTFAVYTILVKKKPWDLSLQNFLGIVFLLGLIFLFPFYVLEHLLYKKMPVDSTIILAILYIGLMNSLLAFSLWNKAITLIGPSKVSFIYYLIPVFSGIFAVLLLGEPLLLIHALSLICIVSGILIASRN